MVIGVWMLYMTPNPAAHQAHWGAVAVNLLVTAVVLKEAAVA